VNDTDFSIMRAAMVDSQLRTNAVTDPAVIDAFASVARDRFVPVDRSRLAYTDNPVTLTATRALNAPLTTARLICEAGIKASDKVLLIGAASGYAAAILSELCAQVVAVEEDADLVAMATPMLAGFYNVSLVEAPLSEGCADHAPYDVIIIDGAIEVLPQSLTDQCADGGKLVCARIDRGVTRLSIGRKTGGALPLITFLDAQSVTLPGFSAPKAFQF
jgi:protein-L-isoaspartate(D-aspartate) O-methyltransferase